ncbi:hypothetical protein D3C81_699720 [compost metagenome]
MLGNESVIEDGRLALGLGFTLPLQDELGHAAQHRHVAAQGRAEERGVGRAVAVGQHLQRVLRVLEAFQAALLERIDAHHLGPTLHRITQRIEHARVVGAGVLAPDEDSVGVFEIIERHRALADADALAEGDAAGLVAHVRAVGEIVGAIGPHEQLIEVRRFVAGAPRGVELGLVRAGQVVQLAGDQGEGGVPGDRLVAVAGRVVDHRFGQPALILQPVVALLKQRGDAVAREERGVDTAFGGFPVDRLGAVLAELDHAAFGRVAPSAAGAVEAAVLVGLEQRANVFQGVVAADPGLGHAAQGTPAAGGTGVGLVARGRGRGVIWKFLVRGHDCYDSAAGL